MAAILYIETNFTVGVAKNQDVYANEFWAERLSDLRVVIPSVCFMEALAVLSFEKKQRNKFQEELSRHAREASRDATSIHAPVLEKLLERSVIESKELYNEIELRLYEVLGRMSKDAEMIALESEVVHHCLSDTYLDDPTDNLILVNIIHHARRHPFEPKAFSSSNHVDFEQSQVTEALEAAGVKYFKRTEAAVGWLRSQVPPEPGQEPEDSSSSGAVS